MEDHVQWDDQISGLGRRIRNGKTTYIYRYRIGSKQRSIKLGSGSLPIRTARRNALELEARVRLGEDPAADIRSAKRETGQTFRILAQEYIDARQSEWAPKSIKDFSRHLMTYAKPLHGLPVTGITQKDVADLLRKLATESGDVTANRVRTTLSAMFGWVLREGVELPRGNVAAYTNVRPERSRERVLNDGELRTVWWNCQDDGFGSCVKLLTLTGQREAEIGGLQWGEITDSEIRLPANRTKNRHPHVIPITSPMRKILDQLPHSGGPYVFGRYGRRPFSNWGQPKRCLDQRIADAGEALEHWTIHDLRRTCASGLQRLQIRPEVIERALNHRSGSFRGVAGIYQRDELRDDVRNALRAWGEHVMDVVR